MSDPFHFYDDPTIYTGPPATHEGRNIIGGPGRPFCRFAYAGGGTCTRTPVTEGGFCERHAPEKPAEPKGA